MIIWKILQEVYHNYYYITGTLSGPEKSSDSNYGILKSSQSSDEKKAKEEEFALISQKPFSKQEGEVSIPMEKSKMKWYFY